MSKKSTTPKEAEPTIATASEAPTEGQEPEAGAPGIQRNQASGGTPIEAAPIAPAPATAKFALRSDDTVLRDVDGKVVELSEQVARGFARLLQASRPGDNWRSEPIE